jgi:hypothetical protein
MNNEAKFQKYKADFLKRNNCTVEEFGQAWDALLTSKPDDRAFRQFARQWHIPVYGITGMPMASVTQFCVIIEIARQFAPTAWQGRGFCEKHFAEILDPYMRQPMAMLLDMIFGATEKGSEVQS